MIPPWSFLVCLKAQFFPPFLFKFILMIYLSPSTIRSNYEQKMYYCILLSPQLLAANLQQDLDIQYLFIGLTGGRWHSTSPEQINRILSFTCITLKEEVTCIFSVTIDRKLTANDHITNKSMPLSTEICTTALSKCCEMQLLQEHGYRLVLITSMGA